MTTITEAFERVRVEHRTLRAKMYAVMLIARVARHDEKRRPDLRLALHDLHITVKEHLLFEERDLVPLLRSAGVWSPDRAEHMADDHAGQRAILLALEEDASDGHRDIEALFDELTWFIRGFERDIRDEELLLFGCTDEAALHHHHASAAASR